MELTISNLIKIILGVLVVVIVIFGIYTVFKEHIIDFFKNFGGNNSAGIIFGLIK